MKKEAVVSVVLFVSVILLSSLVPASSIDDEIQKITHYAEEYETGNIDYIQLLLYTSSARENLNEIMGATGKDYGGLLKEEKIKEVLGSPTEETKWVWVENEERDKKLDSSVPVWNKIIFDGKKIQIKLNAYPSIFKKKEVVERVEEETKELEGKLIYRLHFEIQFKKPGDEKLDVIKKIEEIKLLAENFNSNPSQENAETLARESVNAERSFETYSRQEGGKCEDVMKAIFGAENQRAIQKLLVQEITFYEEDNFEAIARLETCEECEWCWINLDIRMESRGPGFKSSEEVTEKIQESYGNKDDYYFKAEIKRLLDEMRRLMEQGDFSSALALKSKIWELNEEWNKKGNDVWREVDQVFNKKRELMSEEEMQKFNENYGWIKEEQEKRQMAREMQEMHCDKIKNFYLELFSGDYKREFYFTQIEFKQRLVEEFREFGEEICDNNEDDNENGETDCAEEQCGGKICGWTEVEIKQDQETKVANSIEVNEETIEETYDGQEVVEPVNSTGEGGDLEESEQSVIEETIESGANPLTGETIEEIAQEESESTEENEELSILTKKVPLYCINKVCQLKKETIEEKKFVCGNHLCEEGESLENCAEDCSACQEHQPIECPGKVIFKGKDESGCPLEPVCIDESCEKDEDCEFLCGEGECVNNRCKIKELKECKEVQCTDGEEQITTCPSGEKLVTVICSEGLWTNLNIECSTDSTSIGQENCKEHCKSVEEVASLDCLGYMEVSGTYPECSCNWVCEEITGSECKARSDCGGENDVCSNGNCVTIPQVVKVEPEDYGGEFYTQKPETLEPELAQPEPEEQSSEPISEPEEQTSQPEASEPLSESGSEEVPTTGEVIFGFFQALLSRIKITGAITGFQIEDSVPEQTHEPESPQEQIQEPSQESEQSEPPQTGEGERPDENEEETVAENPNEEEQEFKEENENYQEEENARIEKEQQERGYREEKDTREREKREEEQRKNCRKECSRPCIEKCTRDSCGENMDCVVDEEIKKCEQECQPEEDCIEKCMKGGDWWKEFENKEEHKEEKGVFEVGGSCRTSQGRTEAFIWFGGWGEPFDEIQPLKHKYYSREGDWCKEDLENLIKQREEFEKGFNEEFVTWFFEKHLANSAEDWEQSVSGIFEIYWEDVDMSRQMAERMHCLGKEINEQDFNLINVKYETEYGSLEFWEEIKTVNLGMYGMEKIEEGEEKKEEKIKGEKVKIISPYMKIWIFPNKKFMIYEMKESMKNHEFPGPPEEKTERENEEGPTAEEKEMIKQDESFMKKIRKISEKYGGNVDMVVQLKDYESGEVAFNLYVQVNENDILKIAPMLPEEVPEEDIKVEIDFEKVYEMLHDQEKEMRGAEIESPPWDKRSRPVQKVKEIVNGVKMFFKVRSIMNSAKITPEESRGDVKSLFNSFLKMMMREGGEGDSRMKMEKESGEFGEEKNIWESKEKITGEVVS